jgi:O-antigen/teichoic acid export membrane protein
MSNTDKNIKNNYKISSKTSGDVVISNSLYGLTFYLLNVPILLVITPYMIRTLGLETYGKWAALNIVVAYSGILELGIVTALSKYIAESRAKDNVDEIVKLINTGFFFYVGICAVYVALMFVLSKWIFSSIFHIPLENSSIITLFHIMLGAFICNLINGVFIATLYGFQRVDLSVKASIAGRLAFATGVFLFLSMGFGIAGMVYSYTLSIGIQVILTYIGVIHLLPDLKINPFHFQLSVLKKTFRFSSQVQISLLARMVNDLLPSTLIAYFVGTVQLSYFQIASRIFNQFRGVSMSLLSSITPAASDLYSSGRAETLEELFYRSQRYIGLITLGLGFGIIAIALPFMQIWLGSPFIKSGITIVIVVVGYMVWITTGAGSSILNGIGKPQYGMYMSLVWVLIHLLSGYILAKRYGYYGAVSALALSMILCNLYFHYLIIRVLDISSFKIWARNIISSAISGILSAGIVFLLQKIFFIDAFWKVALLGVVYGILMMTFLWLGLGLDSYDRKLILKYIRKIKARFTKLT